LLGQLVSTILRPGKPGSDYLLTAHEVNEVGEIFLQVLTCCRHRVMYCHWMFVWK